MALFIIIMLSLLTISVIGIFMMKEKDIVLQGHIEAEEYNISGLLPGRIESIYVTEGARVEEGDTLVHIISREMLAEHKSQKALQKAGLGSKRFEQHTSQHRVEPRLGRRNGQNESTNKKHDDGICKTVHQRCIFDSFP